MTLWQPITAVRNGDELADLVDLRDRKFDFVLNGICEVSGKLAANSPRAIPAYLTSGANELHLYRSGVEQETVFQLDTCRPATDDDGGNLDLHWSGVISYLQDALVLNGTVQSAGTTEVAWNLINAYQLRSGGDCGFTRGVFPATDPTFVRTWEGDFELLGELAQMSEMATGGFDYAINTSRQFDTWASRGADNGITLEQGINVIEFDEEESTTPGALVNALTIRNAKNPGGVTVTDAASISIYGRREAVVDLGDEDTQSAAQLTEWGNGQLATTKSPLIIPEVTLIATHSSIAWGTYWLGDTVKFRGRIGNYTDIDAFYRIVAIHVDADDEDNETIKLELNLTTT